MKKKSSRRQIDVNVDELDRIIDDAMRAPLNEADGRTLKTAVHAMAERLVRHRNTEKTSVVLEQTRGSSTAPAPLSDKGSERVGHGRNGATDFTGAKKVAVAHGTLKSGDPCPGCCEGKVYRQKEPKALVRIVGRPPLEAAKAETFRAQ